MRNAMKGCLAVVMGSIAGSAMASFELMYLPDATTGKVWRYDPVSNVVLGSFGAAGVNIANLSVAAGTAPGSDVFVTRTGLGTLRYNGSTGVLIQQMSFIGSRNMASPSGAFLFEAQNTNVRRVNVASNSTNSLFQTISNLSFAALSDTVGFAIQRDADDNLIARQLNYETNFISNSPTVLLGGTNMAVSSTLVGQSTMYVGANLRRIVTPYVSNTGELRVSHVTVQNNDGISGVVTFSTSGFQTNAIAGVIAGHDSFYVVGRDSTSPMTTTRIAQYGATGVLINTVTTTAFLTPTARWGGASVVAPEPGTLLALGAGMAAILRRRRRA